MILKIKNLRSTIESIKNDSADIKVKREYCKEVLANCSKQLSDEKSNEGDDLKSSDDLGVDKVDTQRACTILIEMCHE
jgi:hypothetical protein